MLMKHNIVTIVALIVLISQCHGELLMVPHFDSNGLLNFNQSESTLADPEEVHHQEQKLPMWPQFDSNGSVIFNQSERIIEGQGQGEIQGQEQEVACQVIFPDNVIEFFTTTISDIANFVNVELPPFLQVRYPNSQGNILVREYIKTQFQTLGWQVEEDISQQVTPLGPVPFVNVIATWNPQFAKRIVFACHYDSKFLPEGFIGATDGAVPCAMLVDLAKRLAELFTFADTYVAVQMIFFDGNEPFIDFTGQDFLYGSRNLATVWRNTLDPVDSTKNRLGNIDYFINLDVIGHPSTQFERFHQDTSDLYTQLLALESCLALKGQLTRPLPLTQPLFKNTQRAIDIIGDQIPFQQAGVRVAHLVSFPFPASWHTLQDSPGALDLSIIEDLSRILRVFLANYYIVNAFTPLI